MSGGVPGGVPLHSTPASSKCPQLCKPTPRFRQLASRSSVPLHRTSSRKIGPLPGPNAARILGTASNMKQFVERCLISTLIYYYNVGLMILPRQGHSQLLTLTGQIQLPADHLCIRYIPEVITHCAPGVIEAHLHTSLQLCLTSHQPQFTIITVYNCMGNHWIK